MVKLQDFARETGVTDRQVQRLLKKYEPELEGHFERRGSNGTWLDEDACDFLRSKMRTSPVMLVDPEQESEIQKLKATIEKLEERLDSKEDYILKIEVIQIQKQERINELEGQIGEVKLLEGFIADAKAEIEVQKAEKAVLSAEKEQALQKALEAEKKAQELSDELTEAKAELERLNNRGFFKRLFNK